MNNNNNNNNKTCRNKIIYKTPIIVFTYYFGHISYYLYFGLDALIIEIYTKFRISGSVGGFAISSDGSGWTHLLLK